MTEWAVSKYLASLVELRSAPYNLHRGRTQKVTSTNRVTWTNTRSTYTLRFQCGVSSITHASLCFMCTFGSGSIKCYITVVDGMFTRDVLIHLFFASNTDSNA